jgi:hypothetical protein
MTMFCLGWHGCQTAPLWCEWLRSAAQADHDSVTSSNGYLHLLTLNGEVRSSLKAHGAAGSGASEVVRDVCIVPDGDEWEVVSVGYDRQIKISR